MSNYEFTIHVNEAEVKIFTQLGFFNHDAITTSLHKHHYAEIHLIESGVLKYLVGDQHITVCAGELLAIPEKTFHKCYPSNTETSFIAFQLNQPFSTPVVQKSIPGIFSRLREEILEAENTGMCGNIPAYLSLICTDLLYNKKRKLTPILDRNFIIHEFFSHNYEKNVSLADLAAELNLSLKQTERLIAEYTGSTFKKEVSRKRIEAAKHLISTENITLAEAAEQVGYHSYSGFWKAFHTYNQL